eukprot:TRINITY_DN17222_c0_g1_i1.p3 TRINITY_DN17222_c0_g1~~TRINITY_DN17222_c0_g1_i1.p3  ORF type:complete len:125 (-),score=52.54 TRINITY_DN17222_c0_g1_i1:47-421(-)
MGEEAAVGAPPSALVISKLMEGYVESLLEHGDASLTLAHAEAPTAAAAADDAAEEAAAPGQCCGCCEQQQQRLLQLEFTCATLKSEVEALRGDMSECLAILHELRGVMLPPTSAPSSTDKEHQS